MKRSLIIFCINFLALSLLGVPMSPNLEKDLRDKGILSQVVEKLVEARGRGVDAPNPNPIKMRPGSKATLKAIVLLVDFHKTPKPDTAVTSSAHYDSLLQGPYSSGSVRDYYIENSYGGVDFLVTVAGWFDMPETYSYYVGTPPNYGLGSYPKNCRKLTEDAVAAADAVVDFSQFDLGGDSLIDALFVIHAGPGAEETGNTDDIWSHAWATVNVPLVDGVYAYRYSTEPENLKIGVFCHEAGHSVYGLPDLYDYDDDSWGLGLWSLMASGSWGGPSYDGSRPTHLDAYCKILAGFVTPVVPVDNQYDVKFPRVEDSPFIYKLWTEGICGQEYFVVENRQKVLFDGYLPGSGMLIYHIDETQTGNDNQWYPGYTAYGNYLVAMEQADSGWHMEKNVNPGNTGDPYPGSLVNRTFNDGSIPGSKSYLSATTYVGVEKVTDSGDTMTADILVDVPAGAEEQSTHQKDGGQAVRANPNPFVLQTVISKSSMVNGNEIRIYDMSGKMVEETGERVIGKNLKTGVYFVKIENYKPIKIVKLVGPR